MKVIGVRGNYQSTAETKPSVYLMADSTLLKDGKPFFMPDFAERYVAHPSLVVQINRLGKNISRKFANRYYESVTVGLLVKAEGMKERFDGNDPGSMSTAFDGAAIIGEFVDKKELGAGEGHKFTIMVDKEEAIATEVGDMTLDIDGLIEYISKYFTLKIGDIIFTGYGKDDIELQLDTTIEGRLDDHHLLGFKIK